MVSQQRYSGLAAAWLMMAGALAPLPVAAQPMEDCPAAEVQASTGSDWQPVREDSALGIRTWAQAEASKPWRSFRVEARLPGTLDQVERVLFDFDGYSRWYWRVTSAQLLKTVSANEYYLYVVHDSPLDLADRDAVLHVRIEPRSPGQPFARVRINAEPDYLPARPPRVRMPTEDMVITLTPNGNETLLQAEGQFAVGGHEPLWVVNTMQRFVPYTIASNLARLTQTTSDSPATTRPAFRLTQAR